MYWLHYTSQDRYEGKEVMFVSDKLAIPTLTTCSLIRCELSAPMPLTTRRVNTVIIAMRKPKPKPSEEYQNFEKLAKQLISVPESEIDKREAEYQKHKKTTKKRKTA